MTMGATIVSPYILELFKQWLSKRDTSKRQTQKPRSNQRNRVAIWLTRAAHFSNVVGVALSLYTLVSVMIITLPTRATVMAAALVTFTLLVNYHDLRRRMQRQE